MCFVNVIFVGDGRIYEKLMKRGRNKLSISTMGQVVSYTVVWWKRSSAVL